MSQDVIIEPVRAQYIFSNDGKTSIAQAARAIAVNTWPPIQSVMQSVEDVWKVLTLYDLVDVR